MRYDRPEHIVLVHIAKSALPRRGEDIGDVVIVSRVGEALLGTPTNPDYLATRGSESPTRVQERPRFSRSLVYV